MRHCAIQKNYTMYAPGSVLISTGNTRVICTASVEETIPGFLVGSGQGWVTAEYAMLPGATPRRKPRSRHKGADGRSTEIQRLIGRSLRRCVNLTDLNERTIWIDCDVIQADGGTRCASITGAVVALAMACRRLHAEGKTQKNAFARNIAAISAVLIHGNVIIDPCYEEDSAADVDMNIVMDEEGGVVEIQGSAEKHTFSRNQLNAVLDKAENDLQKLFQLQAEALD